MSHFKTQQEIWKYVADGGAVVHDNGRVAKFIDGEMITNYSFDYPESWKPHIEPVPKTKVWRWEKVSKDSRGRLYIQQTMDLICELTAAADFKGYTKAPGSEREI